MEKDKLRFSSVYGAYNKGYEKSDLKKEVTVLQEKIDCLQLKQGILNSFIHIESE